MGGLNITAGHLAGAGRLRPHKYLSRKMRKKSKTFFIPKSLDSCGNTNAEGNWGTVARNGQRLLAVFLEAKDGNFPPDNAGNFQLVA